MTRERRYPFTDLPGANGHKVNQRRRELLGLIREKPTASMRWFAERLDVGVATIHEDLTWLRDDGILTTVPCPTCGRDQLEIQMSALDARVKPGRSKGV